MAFDYVKFLAENELTTTSRIKKRFLKEDKLEQLVAKKDEILAKYKAGELSLDQYRTQIGNIPQQIKNLRADAEKAQNPDLGNDLEDEESIEKTGDKESDVSGVEAAALQKMAGGSQYPDDMEDDEDTPPSRIDMDYYQGDQDETEEI